MSSGAAGCVVELKPKGDDNFKKVVIHLGGALGVERVVITDTFDNVTELDLKNVELNPAVDDKEFVFTPPTGVSVIRETN
ncbi:MAG: outer-membrane lipoprotein carrier protein LolA [Alphaproteobacteria bacterium]|nr:outer-membrane lipoprotein carrier protein LolA [Alphaproteobacteria bacterium]